MPASLVGIKQCVEPEGERVNRRWRPSTEQEFYVQLRASYAPALAERVLALYEHAKENGSRQRFGRGKFPTATAWMGEHKDPQVASPLALTFWGDGGGIAANMRSFRTRRTPGEMARLVSLLRQLAGTSEVLDEAVAKDHRRFCTLPADRVLATDDDLEAFKRVLDDAAMRTPTVT